MAVKAKRLYRSDDAVIAGVCGGIAEYCDIDPVIARILAVLLSVSSLGIAVVVYIVLWLVLPCRVGVDAPISCDAYLRPRACGGNAGAAGADANAGVAATGDAAAFQPAGFQDRAGDRPQPQPRPQGRKGQAPRNPHDAAGFRPGSRPIPPVGHPAWGAADGGYSQAAHGQAASAFAAYAAHYEAAARMGKAASHEVRAGMGGITRLCVWIGVILLAIGASMLFSSLVAGIEWWQLWPCLVILAGVVKMAIPARRTLRMRRFSYGLVLFSAGVMLLFVTTNLLDFRAVTLMLATLWPMLLVALGLAIISRALHDELFSLASALCLVCMCVCAMTSFAIPGSLHYVAIQLPFADGAAHVFDINPWR